MTTAEGFATLMSAVIADVIDGRLTTDVANTTVKAGRTLLKVVEMQYRYGARRFGAGRGAFLLEVGTVGDRATSG